MSPGMAVEAADPPLSGKEGKHMLCESRGICGTFLRLGSSVRNCRQLFVAVWEKKPIPRETCRRNLLHLARASRDLPQPGLIGGEQGVKRWRDLRKLVKQTFHRSNECNMVYQIVSPVTQNQMLYALLRVHAGKR